MRHLILAVSMILFGAVAVQAQQSSTIVGTVPITAKVKTHVNLKATLLDAWTNAPASVLSGRKIEVGVGDQYSISNTACYTDSSGVASTTWYFSTKGKYRVTLSYGGGSGYLNSRVTYFITVN